MTTLARLAKAHGLVALFFTLLAAAVTAGASTSVHNGLTLLALVLLLAAMYVGLHLAIAEEARRTAERTALAASETIRENR